MKLIPLRDSKARKCLRKGIAVSVYVDVSGCEPEHAFQYLQMLGYDPNKKYGFPPTATILSEIANELGHFVVVGANNAIVSGLHDNIFFVDADDEDCYS